ncbi:hypothetical protein DFJ73DRAFT_812881 [Zopfochytrium polystomum]|nr:hypothetical protein DFJ73DRAFT_843734 [Zopfochytrium polystomum]KAI9362560.1 hypothetical protein DFJ73DRAFT_812881 [Zopfochytrium polystomum]
MSSKVIVMFKSGTADDVVEKAVADVTANGGTVTHRYTTAIKGFAATLPDNVFTTLSTNEHVEVIEADGPVSTLAKSKGL